MQRASSIARGGVHACAAAAARVARWVSVAAVLPEAGAGSRRYVDDVGGFFRAGQASQ